MALTVIVIILIILMLALAFGIGSNDETMATLVGSKAIKTKYAIALGAILVLLGVIFLSENVSKTIGENLLGESVEYNVYMLLSIIISTTIWLVVASQTGAPISTTHSVVGAVFGIAIVWSFQGDGGFGQSMDWGTLGEVALGWVISPLLGFFGAILFKLILDKILAKFQKGLNRVEKIERVFAVLLILAVGWSQFSRGGNDSGNALGILYGLLESGSINNPTPFFMISSLNEKFSMGILTKHFTPQIKPIYLIIAVGVMIAFGIIVIGRIVIKNVGNNLIAIKPSDAFSIELATSSVIFLATILGFPISGSHVLIFAIVGAGMAKGEKPNKKSFTKIIISWIITFPVAAALSALIYGIFLAAVPVI
jgi:PiT family inorganic phosphate transporter